MDNTRIRTRPAKTEIVDERKPNRYRVSPESWSRIRCRSVIGGPAPWPWPAGLDAAAAASALSARDPGARGACPAGGAGCALGAVVGAVAGPPARPLINEPRNPP